LAKKGEKMERDGQSPLGFGAARIAFQGEPGAFSEAAAIQLLGNSITTVPRATFDAAFRAVPEGTADALLAPVENTLAGSVLRVYDLLLESNLGIVAETILPIEHHLIACPGATLEGLHSVASHPMALAQCERFFLEHPKLKRVPAEDTAGSVREVLERGDKAFAAIAGRRAAEIYNGTILAESIQDDAENYTRFVLLVERNRPGRPANSAQAMTPALMDLMVERDVRQMENSSARSLKISLALRLAHKPGALLAALEPFARHNINLVKIESRPIHGRPWEYQFFLDMESQSVGDLQIALEEIRQATSFLQILGMYPSASSVSLGK
jgi:prephenate dehydratase